MCTKILGQMEVKGEGSVRDGVLFLVQEMSRGPKTWRRCRMAV